jgi:hypothetical protein
MIMLAFSLLRRLLFFFLNMYLSPMGQSLFLIYTKLCIYFPCAKSPLLLSHQNFGFYLQCAYIPGYFTQNKLYLPSATCPHYFSYSFYAKCVFISSHLLNLPLLLSSIVIISYLLNQCMLLLLLHKMCI